MSELNALAVYNPQTDLNRKRLTRRRLVWTRQGRRWWKENELEKMMAVAITVCAGSHFRAGPENLKINLRDGRSRASRHRYVRSRNRCEHASITLVIVVCSFFEDRSLVSRGIEVTDICLNGTAIYFTHIPRWYTL